MEQLKKALINVGKFFAKKLLIIMLPIIIIVLLLSSIIYFITLDDGTYSSGDMSSTPYVVESTYTSAVKFTENGIKFTYTNEETGVEEEKTPLEMAQITWDTMIDGGSNVRDYLSSAEELEKLMNAELKTQYPKVTGSSVELNGTIEFQRRKTDGSIVNLQYKSLDQFNDYLSRQDLSALNYYTLDESGNLLIAITDETTETLTYNDPDISISDYSDDLKAENLVSDKNYSKTIYNLYSKPINYKSMVSKYTLPFQYLWALITIGDDKGVGLELAELAENSQIIISIYDSVSTTVNTSKYTYNRELSVDLSDTITAVTNGGDKTKSDSHIKDPKWELEDNYVVNHVFTYKTNTPTIDVSKADVWVVDYSKNYNNNPISEQSNEDNVVDLDNTDYIKTGEEKSKSGDGSDLTDYDKFKSVLEKAKADYKDSLNTEYASKLVFKEVVNGIPQYEDFKIDYVDITECKATYYKHNINIKEENITTTSKQVYIADAPINNPKINKKTEAEIASGTGQNNFVTILSEFEHKEAKYRLTDEISSWLFELLETNPDTINMVDLTKYLFYALTGKDYGVTSYDFSVYENSGFTTATGTIYGDSIQEKVWFMLKDMGFSDYSAAGAMGNIHYESGTFDPTKVEGGYNEFNGGIGICQWTNNSRGSTGRNADLRAYAASKGSTWQDETIQVEFLRGELTIGGGADGYAKYQFMNKKSYYGSELACADAWINATNVEDATRAFCYSFERPNKKDLEGKIKNRIDLAQKYYDMYSGMEAPVDIVTTLTGDNKSKMQSMISEAIRIANDDRYQYSQSFRDSEFYYDCSSFVSRLYNTYFGIARLDKSGRGSRGTDIIRNVCKERYMIVSMTSLQPGDILWRDGHVALYIGNNQTAEAASTSSGILVRTKGTFTEAYRIIY